MRLHAVYARFYRSLNYDFIRASGDYEPDPWDATPAGDYPFVRIKLRPGITTIVGANESGKSQVLRAIAAALTGEDIDRSDFCRYSQFFATSKAMALPEFGATFAGVTQEDVETIQQLSGLTGLKNVERVALFRMNEDPKQRLYVRQNGVWTDAAPIDDPAGLHAIGMPLPYTVDAAVPLPASVPIEYLASGKKVASIGREVLRSVLGNIVGNRDWFATDQTVTTNAGAIVKAFREVREPTEDELASYGRADDLLRKVAGLSRDLFVELQRAVEAKNAYVTSIVDTINAELAKALDFPHWWSQDSRFELFVDRLEFDLIFMIRDRTGRTYGFDERSDGMRYFLSYFTQYLAHEARPDGIPEVLLMDEPDQFLSSAGQQDLLKVFEGFADPKNPNRQPLQVVFVTHSPFLIDKNEVDRIRVLEKGEYDEGTRVVNSAAANHYEPLRSAFGSFVAETTFIGNCNLMVEGPSDQVLIAGTSRWLKDRNVSSRDRLDLNHITIVPAGGTKHIPYLVYLARGRDVEKPPVVALLDNDSDGDQAREDLAAGGAYGKTLINDDFVLQLGKDSLGGLTTDNPLGVSSIEDLIPFGVAIEAARGYCQEFVPNIDPSTLGLTPEKVFPSADETTGASMPRNHGLVKYLQLAIAAATDMEKFHLDKIAFARATVEVLVGRHQGPTASGEDLDAAHANFALLNAEIARKQRQAERAEAREIISSRINRIKRDFTRTRKRDEVRVENVLALIEDIEAQLDITPESEQVRTELRSWHDKFGLKGAPRSRIEDFDQLIKAINSLAYKAIRASAGKGSRQSEDPPMAQEVSATGSRPAGGRPRRTRAVSGAQKGTKGTQRARGGEAGNGGAAGRPRP